MSIEPLRERVDSFLEALEEERYELALAQRRAPAVGKLYAANDDLFAVDRITEVQRALAGSTGAEERRLRSLLEFLGRGRAFLVAADSLDRLLGWKVFGSVPVGESRIPYRQIPGALRLAAEPERRHAIEEGCLETLDDQLYLAEEFLTRQKEGISELGYGSQVDAYQILGNIDLRVILRDGERFLAETAAPYFELLAWHLPRAAGVEVAAATAADAARLEAAAEYDSLLPGGESSRRILEAVAGTGLEPTAEGRIRFDWEAYLGAAVGGICRSPRVPELVRLAVSTRSGRPALASFLRAFGVALHNAYTDPELPVEQRRLGDDAVPKASGALFESLLRTPVFLTRVYDFPLPRLGDFLSLSALCWLLSIRRDVARLRFELAYYDDGADPAAFADLMTDATGFRHDPRVAIWTVDPEFTSARRLRAAQLAAIHAATLRNRFDEDWFLNPRAGGYLRDLFAHGRRYSAPELAVQLGSQKLGYEAVIEEMKGLV